ncbi:MAG TPA: hypothetical protein VNV44_09045 [Solirubrobacteraceae bacterium]|jgi:hypothetical protein|nr:hypothetical protein [Solirubrobacteraceae bacterium]
MASKDRLGKASQAAKAAQSNRYVQRLIEDEELRGNLLAAYGAARSAYGRMSNGKPAGKALLEDRKLQSELRSAVESLREAGDALREGPSRRRRRRGLGRTLLLITFGAVLAVALNEGLRSKVLDLLFGAEEEFDYSSTTAPATPEPAGVGA